MPPIEPSVIHNGANLLCVTGGVLVTVTVIGSPMTDSTPHVAHTTKLFSIFISSAAVKSAS
jgi:hypothetical protein